MAMSLWGKVPESSGNVQATGLIFYNEEGEVIEASQDGAFEVEISFEEGKTTSFVLLVDIAPENTTDTSLDIKFPVDLPKPEVEEIITDQSYVINISGEQVHSIHYKFNITFSANKFTKLVFYYNNVGGIAQYKDMSFIFIQSGKDPDIIDL